MHQKNNWPATYMLMAIVLSLCLWTAPQGHAEAWSCEDALSVCAAMNWSVVDPTGLFRCMMGYSFCIEYIAAHLKK